MSNTYVDDDKPFYELMLTSEYIELILFDVSEVIQRTEKMYNEIGNLKKRQLNLSGTTNKRRRREKKSESSLAINHCNSKYII